ncbi:MAG: hypothetical protein AAGA58_12120 [Verrucomicrobiota bacterium]
MLGQLKSASSRLYKAISTPVEHHGLVEILPMRILFAIVCAVSIPNAFNWDGFAYDGQPDPVGLAHFLDLTFLNETGTWTTVLIVYWSALALFGIGLAPAVSATVAALIFNLAGAFEGSQGADKHHLQVIGLTLLVFAVHYIVAAIRAPKSLFRPSYLHHNLAIFHAKQAIVATYLVTAIYKLWYSKFEWIKDSKHFPVQLVKTRDMDYYNSLETPDPSNWFDRLSPAIETFFLNNPNWCRFFIGSGLLLELFAFLALAGRKWGLIFGLALILFHLTISRVMSLTFEENILIIAIFFVNVPGWIHAALKKPAL